MRAPGPTPFYTSSPRRTAMLEVQTKTASRWALSYAYLLAVHHDPTGSIDLRFSFGNVVLEGQSLGELYKALAEQSVSFVREADPEKDAPEHAKPFVRAISVRIAE